MKWTKEQALEQAYVLVARLAELRMDLRPHGDLPRGRALEGLRESLQPLLPEDMQALAAELRHLAGAAIGHQPDTGQRGDIVDITELVDSAGLDSSPAALALIQSMQARCEEVTGDKFLGALWAGGGESMRAVLTIGGIRVPIMPAMKALNEFVRKLAALRAEELVSERLNERLAVVQEVLDHAAAQLKEEFGDPDADLSEAMEAAAEDPQDNPPPGHHKCLECDTVYNAAELEACPQCQHRRPVWYDPSEEKPS